jgi:hypothetical protein
MASLTRATLASGWLSNICCAFEREPAPAKSEKLRKKISNSSSSCHRGPADRPALAAYELRGSCLDGQAPTTKAEEELWALSSKTYFFTF